MSKNKDIDKQHAFFKKNRALRRLGRVILGILIFFVLIVLFIRSPWGQDIIKERLVSYISDKTHTEVSIDRLFLTFDGDIQLDGLYLEDKQGDTLIYSKTLEANIALWEIIRGRGMGVDALDWEGVRANITRKDTITGYNFEFLMDALSASNPSTPIDTTATPMHIVIGDLRLNDFKVVYNDAVVGIDSYYVFDALNADMEITDIETMEFAASNFELENANIKIVKKPIAATQDDSVPLPKLSSEKFFLKNVKFNYQSYVDRIEFDANFSDLYAEIPNINLEESVFDINRFDLKNSKIMLYTQTENNVVTEKIEAVVAEIDKDIQNFNWPEYRFSLTNYNLENNRFGYFVGNQQASKNTFSPNAILLNHIHLKGASIYIKEQQAGIDLESASLDDISGYKLEALSLSAKITDNTLDVKNLHVVLNQNKIQGDLKMAYPSFSALIDAPEKSKIDLNLPDFQLYLNDILKLQPHLKTNPYLKILGEKPLTGNIKASGYLSAVQLPMFNVFWGNTTHISANGTINYLTQPDKLQFNIPNFKANTKRQDLVRFIDEKSLSVNLPQDIELTGNSKGSLNAFKICTKLQTNQGIARIDGQFKNETTMAFNADISIEDYQMGNLLQNSNLGNLTLTMSAKGQGNNINVLNSDFEATVESFQLNNYAIQKLKISGQTKNGVGTLESKYKDDNLNLDLTAGVVLDSIAPEITMELDVIGADLQALGFMNRNVRTGLKLYANFKGDLTDYDVAAIVEDGVVVYDNKTYLLGGLDALAHVRKDTTSVALRNKVLDINLKSNTDPVTFSKALRRHVASYFYRDAVIPDTIANPVSLQLRGKIAQAPILTDVFLVNIKDLDTVDIALDFNEIKRELTANITAPHINYNDYEIDSLAFSMDTDVDKFNFNLGFGHINAGPISLPPSIIKGKQINNELSLNFLAYYQEENMMNIEAKITGNRERLRFHVLPEILLLNKEKWIIPNDNEIILTDKNLAFHHFRINKNNQSIEIIDKSPNISKKHIAVNYNDFKINEVLNYLNPEEKLAKGILNGKFVLQEPFGDTGIIADLSVSQFEVMDVNMGTFTMDGGFRGGDTYDLNTTLKGGDIDMDVNGNYIADIDGAKLNLNVDINAFQMKALTGFSQGAITDAQGAFTGNFKIEGSPLEPKYKGNLQFKDVDFKIAMLNSVFTLKDERLVIDENQLEMDNFTILDENNNTFVMSGHIGTESFLNPTFDLTINAENFKLIDATKEDNEFVYGTAIFDVQATVTGDLQIPKIDMNLNLDSDTDVTYVMPSATVNIEERDGVVIFVNRETPDAILTRTEAQTATLKGFDINADLSVGKNAGITVVIDQDTGDNFKVQGEGDLNFTMSPNGRMNLVGLYEISEGHYEMNLYGLVNRRFDIAKGGRVRWFGDPFDAELDVKAIYAVETSASSLMAPTFSSIDASAKGKYKQVLPFYVYLNIDGELMAPKISFNLDMPEDEHGAIGGQVYGRVQQINQQEDELNRQVFSLLVLNRFYPNAGSDGSQGGFATMARDNLNDALSDQLNLFSEKLFGNAGFEVDFGLDSYTDYQAETPQDRTQLDIAAQKKLLDDRLIVRVGSEVDLQGSSPIDEPTPLIGNVSLEYLITENGRYRIRGFRRNEFENVIDGQTIVTGISLIFTQEFNKFTELWDAMFQSQTQKEKQITTEKEQAEKALGQKEKDVNESMEKKKD
ncbi:translocation/assembly module TamB domain-containing protein [Changchengzhania lutea]|uniref:translocation/assembly module TamB domain-containing protein n=1 Tax=Changchengzhania lutea TaxID=2049305 RepID=UPI001FE501B8|nr:translocation/assembly module TamB domain-containing protein [Changchengzhania lutea]